MPQFVVSQLQLVGTNVISLSRPWAGFQREHALVKMGSCNLFFFSPPDGKEQKGQRYCRDVVVGTITIQIAANGVSHPGKTWNIKIPTDTEEKDDVNHPKETTGARPAAPAGQSSMLQNCLKTYFRR